MRILSLVMVALSVSSGAWASEVSEDWADCFNRNGGDVSRCESVAPWNKDKVTEKSICDKDGLNCRWESEDK